MEKSILPSVTLSVCALLGLVSCATKSSGPKPGSPEFFWISAQAAYRSGDHIKASGMLSHVLSSENPFTTQARLGQILISAGLARGYSDLADEYEQGARMNRANPTPFRKQVSTYRAAAAQYSLQFTDTLHRLMDINKDSSLPLSLPYPVASQTDPPQLKKLRGGAMLVGAEAETLQNGLLQQGLLAVANRLGDTDPAAIFKAGTITRDKFLIATANLLYDQAALFGPTKLDQPKRLYVLCAEALEALDSVPETPETKALAAKIKKLMGTKMTPS